MKLKHELVKLSDKQFFIASDGRTFCADASDLEDRHLQFLDEQGHRGFPVTLEKTGEVVTFIFTKAELFSDDDGIALWEYLPTEESIRLVPSCRYMKAVVWND